jgi:tetratricopeptide (TPR) repeat protein
MEMLGRVGGLCKTITRNGRSFDLGANYITPAYREILKLAKQVRLELYTERPFIAMDVPEDATAPAQYSTIFKASRISVETGEKIGLFAFGTAVLRYVLLRHRLSSFIDKPTFEGVDSYDNGSLTVTLEEWLKKNRLMALARVFQLPTTLMGFGYLNEIPAIYPLKFMTLKTFVPMLIKEIPLIGQYYSWPRRFTYGFQRLWERLAWRLDVRLNVDIERIERTADGVTLHYTHLDQDLDETRREPATLHADYLVLACPLNKHVIEPMLQLSLEEKRLFEDIDRNSYCMTTVEATLDNASKLVANSPLAAVYPVPALGTNIPYGVAKQWDDSDFIQIYTRAEDTQQDSIGPVEEAVVAMAEQTLHQMGAVITPPDKSLRSFNRWSYFRHVKSGPMREGWYSSLEALQGQQRTYYVGGATNFELVEPIAQYAKHQVATHFPPQQGRSSGRHWPGWRAVLLVSVILSLGYCALQRPPALMPYTYPVGDGASLPVSREFWSEFQAQNYAAIAPSNCEASIPDGPAQTGANSNVICRLYAGVQQTPEDQNVPNLLAAAYMWRAQSNQFPQTIAADLRNAIRFSKTSSANGNELAIGFTAFSMWNLGFYLDQQDLIDEALALMKKADEVLPRFHLYGEGEALVTQLDPSNPEQRYDFERGLEDFDHMYSRCLFGSGMLKWLNIPKNMSMNNFMFNTGYVLMRLTGRGLCYNNPPAPYVIQGAYAVQGDGLLKAGQFDAAITAYGNALRGPNINNWRYTKRVRDRLENLATYREHFLKDVGRYLGRDDKFSTIGQSEVYCASCHESPRPAGQ